jgi:hypothetical protein
VASLTGAPAGVIAVDGKTVRRSYQEKGKKAAIHMVFAARQRLVLGQVKVAEKRSWRSPSCSTCCPLKAPS